MRKHSLNSATRWIVASGGAVMGMAILSLLLRHAMISGEKTSLGMFTVVHLSGYLFFIISPVEIAYVHMLGEGYSLLALFALAIGTAFLAQGVDYVIGYAFSDAVIANVIGEAKYRRHLTRIERYGGMTILVFCLLPLSSPIIMLVAGMIRYPFRWAAILSLVGLSLKYLALMLIFA